MEPQQTSHTALIEPTTTSAALVLPLDAAEATLEQVGGKGEALARLARAGLPVPPGFHVTTEAYRRFVAANDLQTPIVAAASEASADDPASLERAAERIRGLFAGGTMPDDVAQAIRGAYAGLAGPGTEAAAAGTAVAVRSSATAEDLPGMSFAGQQETYLNVRGADAVLDAVKRCWASLWTGRAIGYRARHGIAPADVSLAVVVQELVPADAAGVLFTAHPVTGARDQALVNAAWGLGEAVVGGEVTPDSITVDKASGQIAAQEIADKEAMTVLATGSDGGGTRTEPVPDARRRQPTLAPDQVAELVRLGVRIEQLYGQPMDIEWALRDGTCFILQARPITALPEPPTTVAAPHAPAASEWPLPNPRAKYYRASVVELLPEPLSPLFATLALPEWNGAMTHMEASATPSLGPIAPARRFLPRHLDLGIALTTINGFAFYGWQYETSQIPTLLFFIAGLLPLLSKAQARWQNDALPAYAHVVRRWDAQPLADVPAVQLVEGAHEIVTVAARHYLAIQSGILPAAYMTESLFTATYDRLIKRRGDPPALTFLLGYDSTPIRAEQSLYDLAQWTADRQGLAAYLAATPGAQIAPALAGPAPGGVADADWAELHRRFDAHLAEFGHAIYDLDFAKPVPADAPAPLLDALRYFVSGQAADPAVRQRAAAARREEATAAVLRRLGGARRGLFLRLLRPAQRYAPLRESALADVGRGWPVLRRMVREVGRRLAAAGAVDQPDDVFWLTEPELRAAATVFDGGPHGAVARLQARVAERRATWEAQRRLTPPVALPLKGGTRFLGMDWSRFMPVRSEQADGTTIKGTGTSPGRITGVARVLHGPDDFAQMQPGEILVAKITTPAWTPLFALAAGVVTDVGGPLSHGSIVAREYHIPAVLGTGVATARLRSGQRIAVDGDAGTVQVMD